MMYTLGFSVNLLVLTFMLLFHPLSCLVSVRVIPFAKLLVDLLLPPASSVLLCNFLIMLSFKNYQLGI